MKFKNTGTYYGTSTRDVQLLIDESFAERVIPADDSVRLLDQIVEEMDLTPLERAYDVRGRKPVTAPIFLSALFYHVATVFSAYYFGVVKRSHCLDHKIHVLSTGSLNCRVHSKLCKSYMHRIDRQVRI